MPHVYVIPERTRLAITRYKELHHPTGGFLKAVLSNNLMEAFMLSDEENLSALGEIMRYIHWEIPSLCHGSPERVRAWLAKEVAA